MTRIYIIRHCEAQGNTERLFQGRTDGPVSPNGFKQLECLAERMSTVSFDAIYSSPLTRTRATAEAANRTAQLPITLRDDLMEIDGGDWEGLPWAILPDRYPEESRKWSLEPWLFVAPNGESNRQLCQRIYGAITDIARENQGKTVVAVTHGCAIRTLLCRVKGWPLERLNDVEWSDNTGITIIDFDDALSPILVAENDAAHLSDELSTLGRQSWWKKENREKMIYDD